MSDRRYTADGKPRRAFHEAGISTMDRGPQNLAHLGFIDAACPGGNDQNRATFAVGKNE